MTIAAFVASISLCLMAAISPGPAVLMAARIGLKHGLRSGFALAVGIGMGAITWAVAALCGLTLLFDYAPFALTVLRIFGAAYLIWMAWNIWRSANQPLDEGELGSLPKSAFGAFRLGLFTQFSNPKAAVFFGAVFAGTVPPESSLISLVLLLFCIFLGEMAWNTLVARLFSMEKTRQRYVSLKTVIDRVFGGLLAALGVKLAAL